MNIEETTELSLELKEALLDALVMKNQGISSRTIARGLLHKGPTEEDSHPSDVSDFERCQGIVRCHPDMMRHFMAVMPSKSPYWRHLCQVWLAIEYFIDHGDRTKAYELMDVAKRNARKEIKSVEKQIK